MGDLNGKPVEIIPGTPKDVAPLRKELLTRMSSGMKEGATRYGGQLSTGTNPMQTNAASLISNLMGQGNYTPMTGNTMPLDQWGGGEWGSHEPGKETNPSRPRQPKIIGGGGPITKPGTSFDPNVGPTLAQGSPTGMQPPQGMNPMGGVDPRQMMMAELAKRKQRFGI
jgi:hypothetical protein